MREDVNISVRNCIHYISTIGGGAGPVRSVLLSRTSSPMPSSSLITKSSEQAESGQVTVSSLVMTTEARDCYLPFRTLEPRTLPWPSWTGQQPLAHLHFWCPTVPWTSATRILRWSAKVCACRIISLCRTVPSTIVSTRICHHCRIAISFEEWPEIIPLIQSAIDSKPSLQRGNMAPITAFYGTELTLRFKTLYRTETHRPVAINDVQQKHVLSVAVIVKSMAELHPVIPDNVTWNRQQLHKSKSCSGFTIFSIVTTYWLPDQISLLDSKLCLAGEPCVTWSKLSVNTSTPWRISPRACTTTCTYLIWIYTMIAKWTVKGSWAKCLHRKRAWWSPTWWDLSKGQTVCACTYGGMATLPLSKRSNQ